MNHNTATVSEVSHGWKVQIGNEIAIRLYGGTQWELYAVDSDGLEIFGGYAGALMSVALETAIKPHVEAERTARYAACTARKSLNHGLPPYAAPL
jgi:hypothetical protein